SSARSSASSRRELSVAVFTERALRIELALDIYRRCMLAAIDERAQDKRCLVERAKRLMRQMMFLAVGQQGILGENKIRLFEADAEIRAAIADIQRLAGIGDGPHLAGHFAFAGRGSRS